MFYKKRSKIYYPLQKRVTINTFAGGMNGEVDEGVRSLGYGEVSYNLDMKDGALKHGEGVDVFTIGFNAISISGSAIPLKIYFYSRYNYDLDMPDDKLLAYCNDGKIYSYSLYNNTGELLFFPIENLSFTSPPIAINYNYNGQDVILLSSKTDGLIMLNGNEVTVVEGAPDIISTCVHNERIFAVASGNGTSLWFSDDFNPTNWNVSLNEAGFINMVDNRGEMHKVLSFQGYVYVFRTYGISRVTADADQEDFRVLNLYTSQSKIYGNSVTMCGDYAVYLAEDGFYRFDGVSCSRILKNYDKYLLNMDNQNAEGVFTEGKLYMKVNMRLNGKIESVIVVYDVSSRSTYLIKDINITSFCALEGENRYAVCLVKDRQALYYLTKNGSYCTKPLEKVWISANTDFNIPTVKKRIEKVVLTTDYDITLKITADGKRCKIFKIKGGGVKEIKPYIKGEVFKLEILSNTPFVRIVSPTLTVSYY